MLSSSLSAILHIQVTLSFIVGVLHNNLLNNYLMSISKELHVRIMLIYENLSFNFHFIVMSFLIENS